MLVELAADARQVDRLAAGHAGAAGGAREQAAQARLQRRRDAAVGGRQHLEGQRLHGVAGEHRLGDAEADVHGRLAAAQDVVVHARQVVVDERIGVDQLDRAGRAQRRRALAVHGVGGGQHEQRPQPLAAVEDGVAHRLAEAGRRVGRNAGVERRLDGVELGQRPGVERRRASCAGPRSQLAVLEHLDLLLDRLQARAAVLEQLGAAAIARRAGPRAAAGPLPSKRPALRARSGPPRSSLASKLMGLELGSIVIHCSKKS